jgi:hypothetical protein
MSKLENPSDIYEKYVNAINALYVRPPQAGGDSVYTDPPQCPLLDPRALYLLFGSEGLSDNGGQVEEVVQEPETYDGGGSISNNVALSVLGLCVTVVAAAVSSLSPNG